MSFSLKVPVAAGAIVLFQNQVLLVQLNNPHHKKGLWGLPGGKLNRGESLEQGMMRELKEETGIIAHSYTYHHIGIIHEKANAICKHVFLVNLHAAINSFSFDAREIMQVKWVQLDKNILKGFTFRTEWIYPLLVDIAEQKLPKSGLPLY